jgi:hypothetical protein
MRKLSLVTIAMLALTLVTAAPVSAGSTKRVKDIRPGKISSGSGFSHHCRRVGLLHGG